MSALFKIPTWSLTYLSSDVAGLFDGPLVDEVVVVVVPAHSNVFWGGGAKSEISTYYRGDARLGLYVKLIYTHPVQELRTCASSSDAAKHACT